MGSQRSFVSVLTTTTVTTTVAPTTTTTTPAPQVPVVSVSPADTTKVDYGGSASLNCTVEGTPPLSVALYQNGHLVNEEKGGEDNAALVASVDIPQLFESVTIECRATNEYGQESQHTYFEVLGAFLGYFRNMWFRRCFIIVTTFAIFQV